MNTSMIDYNKAETPKQGGRRYAYDYHGTKLEIPEAFWDAGRETANIPALLKSAQDMRRKVSAQVKAPEKYDIRLPEDVAARREVNAELPLVQAAMAWAQRHNLSQEAFDELVETFVRQEEEALDPAKFRELQMAALNEKFGHRCDEVCRDVGHWFGGLMQNDFDDQPELREAAEELASDARGVMLLKAIRDRLTERGVPDNRHAVSGPLDEAALQRLQASDAYINSRHPDHKAVARRVREGWLALTGEKRT